MSCCNVVSDETADVVVNGYNTASGMSCCNFKDGLTADGAVRALQYRKRYELLQQLIVVVQEVERLSGLQYRKRYELLQRNRS